MRVAALSGDDTGFAAAFLVSILGPARAAGSGAPSSPQARADADDHHDRDQSDEEQDFRAAVPVARVPFPGISPIPHDAMDSLLQWCGEDDGLDWMDVLPGFMCAVSAIFGAAPGDASPGDSP